MTDFSTHQVKEFKKLLAHPPMATSRGISENFLLQFVLFEALTRTVGRYYRERNGERKKSDSHAPLDIEVVKRSFAYFSIPIADERFGFLLDSKRTKRNEKSARELRNGLSHHWKAEDVKEVVARDSSLSSALTAAIEAIQARVKR